MPNQTQQPQILVAQQPPNMVLIGEFKGRVLSVNQFNKEKKEDAMKVAAKEAEMKKKYEEDAKKLEAEWKKKYEEKCEEVEKAKEDKAAITKERDEFKKIVDAVKKSVSRK